MKSARTQLLWGCSGRRMLSCFRDGWPACVCLLVWCGLFVDQAQAELQIEGRPRWGFDGTISLQQFNLLTFTVFNNSPDPWQGALTYEPSNGIQSVDAPIRQDGLYIEPFGSRVLQFYVFFPYPAEGRLSATPVGRRFPETTLDLDSPQKTSGPITIRLMTADRGGKGGKAISVDEQIFPGSAVVLHGVNGIALDHAPRLQEPQIQALKDWLFAGGTLYLLPDSTGTYPEFSGTLSEFNVPADRSEFGGGLIVRLTNEENLPAPPQPAPQTFENYLDNTTAETVFRNLRAITTPDHNWYMIYAMAFLYLLVLFPGCWLLGRKRGDFRLTYGVIVLTVAFFSLGFHTVGKRGYGESTSINTVVLAKAAQPGRWIVKQWSNFFVTTGGEFLIEYPVDSSAYSSGQHTEGIRGIVLNQPDGKMLTEIPSFSNRTIFQSGIQKLTGLRPVVESAELKNGKLSRFSLSLPEGQTLPEDFKGYLIFQDEVIELTAVEGNRIVAGQDGNVNQSTRISSYINESSIRSDPTFQYRFGMYGDEEKTTVQEYFDGTLWPVIADDLGIRNANEVGNKVISADRIHVYLKTPMTQDFFATASGNMTPQQDGYVIYTLEYPVPVN